MWNFGVSVKLGRTSQYEGVSKAQLIAENEELKRNDTLLDQKIQEFMKIVAELQQKMKGKKNKKTEPAVGWLCFLFAVVL